MYQFHINEGYPGKFSAGEGSQTIILKEVGGGGGSSVIVAKVKIFNLIIDISNYKSFHYQRISKENHISTLTKRHRVFFKDSPRTSFLLVYHEYRVKCL